MQDIMTIGDCAYAVRYSIDAAGIVFLHIVDENGELSDAIVIDPMGAEGWEAVDAADPALGDRMRKAAADAAQEAQRAKWAQQKASREARRADQKPRDAAAMPWVGQEIKGNGWCIYFDPAYDRTRVIFPNPPRSAVREIVKAAGFYWSPQTQSWNKKLTHKAYRAAMALCADLNTMGNGAAGRMMPPPQFAAIEAALMVG